MEHKKSKPVTISHEEILDLAIRHLEYRVNNWADTLVTVPHATSVEERLAAICADDLAKIEMLKTMYLFETGTKHHKERMAKK